VYHGIGNYKELILNSEVVRWAQQELSIKLRRWLGGGPTGIVYHGIGDYTGA